MQSRPSWREAALLLLVFVLNFEPSDCSGNFAQRADLAASSISRSVQAPHDAPYEGIYRIRQKLSGRYLDAYEGPENFQVVTRTTQYVPVRDGMDRTQYWIITKDKGDAYSLMQYTSGRFLEAAEEPLDPRVTGTVCYTNLPIITDGVFVQSWYIFKAPNADYDMEVTIAQASTERLVGASGTAVRDYEAVAWHAPPEGPVGGQRWVLEKIADRPLPLYDGIYAIQQKATDRRIDALLPEPGRKDTFTVTREISFSPSQRFIIRRVQGEVYLITQQWTGHILGAHPPPVDQRANYSVVTRDLQADGSQEWLLTRQSFDTFAILHVASRMVLDAYVDDSPGHGHRVYTTAPTLASVDGNVSTELWRFVKIANLPALDGVYRLRQRVTGRYLAVANAEDQHEETIEPDVDANDPRQLWDIRRLGGDVYAILLNGTQRSFEADMLHSFQHELNGSSHLEEFHGTGDEAQEWYAVWCGGTGFRIRNHGTHRYVDAWPDGIHQHRVVATDAIERDSQIWDMIFVGHRCVQRLTCPAFYECGQQDDGCGGVAFCGTSGDGTCTQRNPLTGEQHRCGEDRSCQCIPREVCDFEFCGLTQDDGCGGLTNCTACADEPTFRNLTADGSAASNTANNTLAPPPTPLPCLPKLTCSDEAECGFEEDGCGGEIACGNMSGYCPTGLPMQACSTDFKCECVPDSCRMRCGSFDDGCGSTMTCGCDVATAICHEESGQCIRIPGAPLPMVVEEEEEALPTGVPTLLSDAPAGTNILETNMEEGFGVGQAIRVNPGAVTQEDCVIIGFGSLIVAEPLKFKHAVGESIMALEPPPLPTTPTTSTTTTTTVTENVTLPAVPPPEGLQPEDTVKMTPDLFRVYSFLYYFFYYYHWQVFRAAGVAPADAAMRASQLAKPSAQEQLQHMLRDPTSPLAKATYQEVAHAVEDPAVAAELVPPGGDSAAAVADAAAATGAAAAEAGAVETTAAPEIAAETTASPQDAQDAAAVETTTSRNPAETYQENLGREMWDRLVSGNADVRRAMETGLLDTASALQVSRRSLRGRQRHRSHGHLQVAGLRRALVQ